jgi:diacylglycerol kinase family enzyme
MRLVRRLVLITNPNAKRVTRTQRDDVAQVLAEAFDVERLETKAPGHAVELASLAADDGVDLVVTLGGDGTVNEAANGLAGTDVPLAVLPGGGANVFMRSLGVPEDIVEAARSLVDGAATAPRRVPLGRVDGRYFVANCGVGFDGAIVRRVEARQRAKMAVGDLYFVWQALRVFFRDYDRRNPHIDLSWGPDLGQSRQGLFLAIAQNVAPYTYLGRRAMRLNPDARLEGGLDCMAMDSMRIRSLLPVALSSFVSTRRLRRSPHVLLLRDQSQLRVRCDLPLTVQCDGELVGERSEALLECVPDALSIVCPPSPTS